MLTWVAATYAQYKHTHPCVTIVGCAYLGVAMVACCCTGTITRIPRRVIRSRRWIAGIQDVTCKYSRMIALWSLGIEAMQDELNIRIGGMWGEGRMGGEGRGGEGRGGEGRGGEGRGS